MKYVAIVGLVLVVLAMFAKETHERERAKARVLFQAVQEGDLERVRKAIEGDPQAVHFRDWQGIPPLHHAAAQCRLGIAELLIASGANVDEWTERVASRPISTPLMKAARSNCGPVARLLLRNGADPSVRTDYGWSALTSAAYAAEHAGVAGC